MDKARKEVSKESSKLGSFLENLKQERDRRSRGGVDNICYTYKTMEPLLILFYYEIMVQRRKLNLRPFVFQQDNALSYIGFALDSTGRD